jgi:hypothetical protein
MRKKIGSATANAPQKNKKLIPVNLSTPAVSVPTRPHAARSLRHGLPAWPHRLGCPRPALHRDRVRFLGRRARAPMGQNSSAMPQRPSQPSVEEVRRAIGVADDAPSATASLEAKNSAFMDLVASTPIGKPESEPERRLREAAEWVVDTTEARAREGCDVTP